MNLNFKKACSDVFSLKYIWIYVFFAAVIGTLSSIFQSAEGIPYHKALSNIISVFTYISTGYLLIMVNNLLHENNLNNENENFWQNLLNSTKKGFKCFFGTLLNTLIVFFFGAIIALAFVLIFMAVTHIAITENNILSFPFLKITLGLLAIVLMIFMLFILKLLPIAYAEEFSIKAMFRWKKVFKVFFLQNNAKKTFCIIGLYIISELIIFLTMFLLMFAFNIAFIFLAKSLLATHYVLTAFLINISSVMIPFLGAIAHYLLISIIFNMLTYVYKK